tara:strand:- start:248 stop:514 length:267 start_codon:yes stop_codon:yes gene_type:complete
MRQGVVHRVGVVLDGDLGQPSRDVAEAFERLPGDAAKDLWKTDAAFLALIGPPERTRVTPAVSRPVIFSTPTTSAMRADPLRTTSSAA